MGRHDPTAPVEVSGLRHSVAELSWGVLRGADGPSDGSAGAASNVPSALGVLRHAKIYAHVPGEIEDAFNVLEHHVMRNGVLFPVSLAAVPFLFDTLRRGSPIADRIAELIAHYAALADTLDAPLSQRLRWILDDHAPEIIRWLGHLDLAVSALALYVPALREPFLAAVEGAERVAPEVLLALVELGEAPGDTMELALAMLDGPDATNAARMCAAAFLARFGAHTPELRKRVDAALPPGSDSALRNLVDKLWSPQLVRPAVAPTLYDAEVTFTGKKLVIVRAAGKSVTLPWSDAHVASGDRLQVGLTARGEPKLAVVTDRRGNVRVIDFAPGTPAPGRA